MNGWDALAVVLLVGLVVYGLRELDRYEAGLGGTDPGRREAAFRGRSSGALAKASSVSPSPEPVLFPCVLVSPQGIEFLCESEWELVETVRYLSEVDRISEMTA